MVNFNLISNIFTHQEFSLENIACFKDIIEYKKLQTLDERKKHLEKIKNLYFGSNAELEV